MIESQAQIVLTKLDNGRVFIRSSGDGELSDLVDRIVDVLDVIATDKGPSLFEQVLKVSQELEAAKEIGRQQVFPVDIAMRRPFEAMTTKEPQKNPKGIKRPKPSPPPPPPKK